MPIHFYYFYNVYYVVINKKGIVVIAFKPKRNPLCLNIQRSNTWIEFTCKTIYLFSNLKEYICYFVLVFHCYFSNKFNISLKILPY